MPKTLPGRAFSLRCTQCPRLADFLKDVRQQYPDYHGRPVPAFGETGAPVLIVGLAPGMHGANATGRPFTGDHAGIILYETLHRHGFANQAESTDCDDGMQLSGVRITNAVKCLPPQNKPIGSEINTCNQFLLRDLHEVPRPGVILALGGIAHRAVIKAMGLKQAAAKFGHGAEHDLGDGLTLLDSYHCSRYNTQTKRLTPAMFDSIFKRLRVLHNQRL